MAHEISFVGKLYQNLLTKYGAPVAYWPQWCAVSKNIPEREKIIIGMILVQRTSWHNANIALKNLKREGLLSLSAIANLSTLNSLTQIIRSAGFYQSKPQRLFNICTLFVNHGGVKRAMNQDSPAIRDQLLKLKGIGQETADTILLYALDKPVFIIDEYTRRWVENENLTKEKDYIKLQNYFYHQLEPDLTVYQNLHALIIISQRGREKSMMEIV